MFTFYSEIGNCLLTDHDLKTMNIDTTNMTTEELTNRKLFRLPYAEQPTPGQYQYVVELNPTKVEGVYVRQYEVREMFTEDYTDPFTGETLTIEQQQQRHDEQLAADAQYKTNVEARAYLASTDWYVIRKAETGIDIPEDILELRSAARASVQDFTGE